MTVSLVVGGLPAACILCRLARTPMESPYSSGLKTREGSSRLGSTGNGRSRTREGTLRLPRQFLSMILALTRQHMELPAEFGVKRICRVAYHRQPAASRGRILLDEGVNERRVAAAYVDNRAVWCQPGLCEKLQRAGRLLFTRVRPRLSHRDDTGRTDRTGPVIQRTAAPACTRSPT